MVIDKESVYDGEISPLVQQIIEICQRENIPFVMDFGLREGTRTQRRSTACRRCTATRG